jgi:hypothetical protein
MKPVRNQVRDQVVNKVEHQFWDQVNDQVLGQVEVEVYGQVREQVLDQVWHKARSEP